MNKFITFGFLSLLLNIAVAQKDPQAWKTEKSLESQFKNLKENVSSWNGFVMIKEPQLNEFHKSLLDTVKNLEGIIDGAEANISSANKEISVLSKKVEETQTKLDVSLSKEDELVTLGIPFDKNAFPAIMYFIIILCVAIALVAFFLFFRSNAITKKTEKLYEDLTEELKAQKTTSLERETKLARELQTERNKNYSS